MSKILISMKEENEAQSRAFSDKQDEGNTGREEIFTKVVRAGNRTYFFDVKATRKNDLYLTITESKKRFNKDGKFFFEKHKIFLYQEDFIKFINGLEDAFDFVNNENKGITPQSEKIAESASIPDIEKKDSVETSEFINVEFEDLGDK